MGVLAASKPVELEYVPGAQATHADAPVKRKRDEPGLVMYGLPLPLPLPLPLDAYDPLKHPSKYCRGSLMLLIDAYIPSKYVPTSQRVQVDEPIIEV